MFAQADGFTLFYVERDHKALRKRPIEWGDTVNQDGPFWRALKGGKANNYCGIAVIPPVETMFFATPSPATVLLGAGSDATKLKIGRTKVAAREVYDNLFLLDAFSPHHQAYLYADRKQKKLTVLSSSEQGASIEGFQPMSFEAYFEGLFTGLGAYRHFVLASGKTPSEYHVSPTVQLSQLP